MSQSLVKNMIHLVYSTKNRKPWIPDMVQQDLYAYQSGILTQWESPALIIGGVEDHVHALFSLSKNRALKKIVEEVKKGSSKWMKTNKFCFALSGLVLAYFSYPGRRCALPWADMFKPLRGGKRGTNNNASGPDVSLLAQRAGVICAVLSILLGHCSTARAQDASDMETIIVPFVQKHCAHCHGGKKPKGDMSLSAFKDEASILKARKTWVLVLEQLRSGEMPPKERPRPAFDEADRFTKAVRGVFVRFDRTAPRDPGVVTMRRLNRAEYINTVRDLVGVTIPLAEDFPADQMGHGFDNIGDVLTLSPLQLERYLASADAIVNAAIVVGEPPTPVSRHYSNSGGSFKFDGPSYGPNYDARGAAPARCQGRPDSREGSPARRAGQWLATPLCHAVVPR